MSMYNCKHCGSHKPTIVFEVYNDSSQQNKKCVGSAGCPDCLSPAVLPEGLLLSDFVEEV